MLLNNLNNTERVKREHLPHPNLSAQFPALEQPWLSASRVSFLRRSVRTSKDVKAPPSLQPTGELALHTAPHLAIFTSRCTFEIVLDQFMYVNTTLFNSSVRIPLYTCTMIKLTTLLTKGLIIISSFLPS